LTAGTNITFSSGTTYNGSSAITINATASPQVYPGAGIANSTGTAWGTSYSTTGSGTVVALATSPTFVTPILGTPTSVTLTNATGLPLTTGVTGTLPIANGGTGQTTASTAFNALSPITTTGDLIIGNGTNSATRLAIGANTYVLTSNGTTASWVAPSAGSGSSISNGTSNVTVNSSGGTVTIATAGTTALTVDTSQNVGIGVTPNTWNTGGGKTLQLTAGAISAYSTDNIQMVQNIYFNSGWIYKTSNYATIYNQSVGQHTWFTAPSGTAGNTASLTQVMTLDASGKLLVGTTSAFSGSGINPRVTVSNTAGIGLIGIGSSDVGMVTQPAANTNYYAGFFLNSSSTGVGNIFCTGSSTAYNTSSDYRLKHDIQPMTGALAKVQQLKPVTYKWNADNSQSQGFIAHELQAVVPECVTGEKDAVDADGNPDYQGIDTSFLVATLTSAIQELSAQVTELKAEVATLKGA
jgi:hypothetical protein